MQGSSRGLYIGWSPCPSCLQVPLMSILPRDHLIKSIATSECTPPRGKCGSTSCMKVLSFSKYHRKASFWYQVILIHTGYPHWVLPIPHVHPLCPAANHEKSLPVLPKQMPYQRYVTLGIWCARPVVITGTPPTQKNFDDDVMPEGCTAETKAILKFFEFLVAFVTFGILNSAGKTDRK